MPPAASNKQPVVTVLGKVNDKFLVRTSWGEEGQGKTVSARVLDQLQQLGIKVVDDAANYVFT